MSRDFTKSVPVSNKLGGSIFMLIALVILGFAGFQIFRIWQFNAKAQHTSGTVDRLYIDYGKMVHLKMHYHYVGDGIPRTTTADVSHDTYGQFRIGDTVPVLFLPDAPSDSRLDLASETQREWDNVWLLSLIGFPVFIFAAFIYRLPPDSTHA